MSIDKLGYQRGLATTRPRKAKKGAAVSVTSLSPLASTYESQNNRKGLEGALEPAPADQRVEQIVDRHRGHVVGRFAPFSS